MKRIFFFIAILFIIISFIPDFLLRHFSGNHRTHSNFFASSQDYNAEMSWAKQAEKNIFPYYYFKYTTEKQKKNFLHPYFSIVGITAFLTKTDIFVINRIFNAVAVIFFIIVSITFIKSYFVEKRIILLILILLLFASGGGWLLQLSGFLPQAVEKYFIYPNDLWMPQSIPFMFLLYMPKVTFAISFFLIALMFLINIFNDSKIINTCICSIAIIIAGFFHAYLTVIFFMILFFICFFMIISEKSLIKQKMYSIFCITLSGLIPVFYYEYIQFSDSLNRAYINKFFQPSPNISAYLIGFGIFTPLFLYALFKLARMKYYFKIDIISICAIWSAGSFILAYIPFINFQRRLTDCIMIPIIILSVFSIKPFILNLSKKKIIFFIAFSFAVTVPSNLLFLYETAINLKDSRSFYYLDLSDKDAMLWLESNSSSDDIVFSSLKTGNYIPAISGNTVFLGHWDFTFDYNEKNKFVFFFYKGIIPENDIKKFFKQNNIKYVFFGEHEKLINKNFKYSQLLFKEIYSNNRTQIFKFLE